MYLGTRTSYKPNSRRFDSSLLLIAFLAPFNGIASFVKDLVDDTELNRLIDVHEVITVHHPLDLLQRLSRVLHVELIQIGPRPEDLLGHDIDVGRHALRPPGGLVEHNPRVGQGVTTARRATGQQEAAHAGRLAHADGVDVGLDVLHGVVHGHPGRDDSSRRVDVHVDGGRRILGLQEEELGRHQRGHVVVDLTVDADDALSQEAAEYVEGSLSAGAALDDDGDQTCRRGSGGRGYASVGSTCTGTCVGSRCRCADIARAPDKRRSSSRPPRWQPASTRSTESGCGGVQHLAWHFGTSSDLLES